MDYTDYLWMKLIFFAVAAFIYGALKEINRP
jgi:hypothetical protein